MNEGLAKVDQWLCSNRLSLNVSKTTYMVISNKAVHNEPNIYIRNQKIDRVNHHKFLGVTIDSNLRFTDHINKLCSVLSRSLGTINRVAHFLPSQVMRNLFFSLIYAITVCGSAYSTAQTRLTGLYNRVELYQYHFSGRYRYQILLPTFCRYPDTDT